MSRFLLEVIVEFRTLMDKAKIVVDSTYVALDGLRDASEIDAVREMLKEPDEPLAEAQADAKASTEVCALSQVDRRIIFLDPLSMDRSNHAKCDCDDSRDLADGGL